MPLHALRHRPAGGREFGDDAAAGASLGAQRLGMAEGGQPVPLAHHQTVAGRGAPGGEDHAVIGGRHLVRHQLHAPACGHRRVAGLLLGEGLARAAAQLAGLGRGRMRPRPARLLQAIGAAGGGEVGLHAAHPVRLGAGGRTRRGGGAADGRNREQDGEEEAAHRQVSGKG